VLTHINLFTGNVNYIYFDHKNPSISYQ
jgi:hypothetical protein